MNKLKSLLLTLNIFLISNAAHAIKIEAQLQKTARKGQGILLAALPIFVLSIAYLYKRGKSEAKDRMENLFIGGLLVATAFGWSFFFK